MPKDNRNITVGVFAVLGVANLLAWLAVFDLAKPQYLEVTFFDVGQGDAIFIETPQRHQILVDGGPDETVLEKLGKEMPFWDRTIDLIVLTHPEHDHMAGLLEALKRYKVKSVLWTGVVRDTAEYAEWLKLLEKENAYMIFARAGRKITCEKCRRQKWEMEILFPFEELAGNKSQKTNDTSVVSKIITGNIKILLTGDIEKQTEAELIRGEIDIGADVLKVAHHGSKTSSLPEFVAAVAPSFAVISVGKDNRYGHPHVQTLETLQNYVPNVLRTDIKGDIKFLTDGKTTQLK